MKSMSSKTHGMLDYALGLLLLFAPEIFRFSAAGGPAEGIPRVLGAIIVLQALMTDYELGVVRLVPLPVHLFVDSVAGIFLALSPFIFGFFELNANAWAPHCLAGIVSFAAALNTETLPEKIAYGSHPSVGAYASNTEQERRDALRRGNE